MRHCKHRTIPQTFGLSVLVSFVARTKNCLFIFSFTLFIITGAKAQQYGAENRHHQLTASCDNNLFLLNGEDGYYTNGVFLQYDRLSKKYQSASLKRIFSYGIGQMIYIAHSRKILAKGNSNFPGGIEQIDRPITGYLFGKASYSSFYSDKMLRLDASIGSIGKNALGRQVQESWHKVIGIKDHWNWVWDYQLKSETGINLTGTYAFSLIKSARQPPFQIIPVTQVTLGTIFTNASQAVVFQLGKFRHISSSSYWNSRLQASAAPDDNGTIEWFLFYKPEIKYQAYNATLQGGMFRDDKGPITSGISPVVVSQDIGIRYSSPKYCFGYHVTFQTREAKGQFNGHMFANIFFTCRY